MKSKNLLASVLSVGLLGASYGMMHPSAYARAAGGADLSVSLSPVSDTAGSYQYRVTLDGHGPETAAGVTVTMPFAKGDQAYVTHLVSPSMGGCSVGATAITCSFDTVANGQSALMDVNVYRTKATAKAGVSATVSASSPDPDKSNNTARLMISLR